MKVKFGEVSRNRTEHTQKHRLEEPVPCRQRCQQLFVDRDRRRTTHFPRVLKRRGARHASGSDDVVEKVLQASSKAATIFIFTAMSNTVQHGCGDATSRADLQRGRHSESRAYRYRAECHGPVQHRCLVMAGGNSSKSL